MKHKILIVDDNEELCKNFSDILELKGYDIIGVYDGYKAVEAIKKHGVDIVIMDVKMPGINGLETLKLMKQIEPNITVFMITAFADDILYKEGLQSKDFKVIQKPVDIDKILAMLAEVKN